MQAVLHEPPDLGIPEVKPAIESIRGRWAQKMSPRRRHAILQGRLFRLIEDAFGERGEVGSEWRFYILPPAEKPSSLVPDVAYVSFERMPLEYGELREEPTIPPDIAVEIISPYERRKRIDEKTELYLENGTLAVMIVDPQKRFVAFRTTSGESTFYDGEIAMLSRFPEIRVDVTKLFEKL